MKPTIGYCLVKLHDNPELIDGCALLLNKQWQRSLTSRLHSLNKSCDDFPLSLVLINNNKTDYQILGHIRVKREPLVNNRHTVFIESLIVDECVRGQGFGKYIMLETERLVKQMGFLTITLTTTDKQEFYRHLGYREVNLSVDCNQMSCRPMSSILSAESPQMPTPPPPPVPPPMPSINKSNNLVKVLMLKNI
ncbi:N-alpha-acetyltransferase 80-like [Oppia nitens]|uniref:N-alpha-acetyltransferase 80-like n=1 Tax=Oppia nitens TaxID=1686743 RepID=UPI0023DAB352|nr:N-alpha-acetyltransferase 80-like [Oppia nitens]